MRMDNRLDASIVNMKEYDQVFPCAVPYLDASAKSALHCLALLHTQNYTHYHTKPLCMTMMVYGACCLSVGTGLRVRIRPCQNSERGGPLEHNVVMNRGHHDSNQHLKPKISPYCVRDPDPNLNLTLRTIWNWRILWCLLCPPGQAVTHPKKLLFSVVGYKTPFVV